MEPQNVISDYAFLSDCHSAALVRGGSVDWLCLPRFDSPSVFAAILDRNGGAFALRPRDDYHIHRRYESGTNVLVTRLSTVSGEIELVDYLALRPLGEDGVDAHPYHALVRHVRCTVGTCALEIVCDPRPDYGRAVPAISRSGQRWLFHGQTQSLVLDTDAPLQSGAESGLHGALTLHEGDELSFALQYAGSPAPGSWPDPIDAAATLESTRSFWRQWSARLQYTGRYQDAVRRSALVLKGLTYAPTGGIIAAPTTSLPEEIGGSRNWDYRYCWLRDSTLTLYALDRTGCSSEALRFRRWLERASAKGPGQLRIAYTVDEDDVPPEQELGNLRGFRDSQPVRVGNSARHQVQLDVFGELMDTAFFANKHGEGVDPEYWSLLNDVAEHVCDHWGDPDQGLWEMRTAPQQFVYSKVLCWVCLNRAIRIARSQGVRTPPRWQKEMRAIHEQVLEHGYNPTVGAFVQAYGSTHLDAANLALPTVGFIDAHDPRMASTIRLTDAHLTVDGLTRRYEGVDDGVGGGREGAFLICSFWLVDALIMLGDRKRARARFEQLLSYCNDVGLLSEEYDVENKVMLGNFPQAFSHLGLITSALNLRVGQPNRRHVGPRQGTRARSTTP